MRRKIWHLLASCTALRNMTQTSWRKNGLLDTPCGCASSSLNPKPRRVLLVCMFSITLRLLKGEWGVDLHSNAI